MGLVLLASAWLYSCSQYSQKPMSVAYHNFAANYNAYFLAKANMDSAEAGITRAYKENPNQLLPILFPIDTNLAKPFRPNLDLVVKNASIIAEKHQNSKWLDNSYTLLGKARMYLGQWDDGIEALRYVLAKSEDEKDKNDALIFLMRAYVEKKDYSNALTVSEYLRQQPLSTSATIDFYLTKAYLHQKTEEYLTSVAILEEVLPLMKKSPQKARVHFIAGQLYDLLEKYAQANQHYKRVPRNKPHYDLSFYAKMNSLQNQVALNPQSSIEEVGFEKMLRDRKNIDLKDKIYFTMGKLAEEKGDYAQALRYLSQSAQASGLNTSQVPYTYLEIARIYTDRLMQFEPAKAYFDSAMALMPASDPAYQQFTERKAFLDQFVAHMTVINTEDSLQRLASLPQEQLAEKIHEIIAQQQKDRREAYEREQAALLKAQQAAAQTAAVPVTGPRWQLYDPAQISLGKSEFARKWGNRKLEDNWRRLNKPTVGEAPAAIAASDSLQSDSSAVAETTGFNEITRDSEEWNALYESLLRNVPLTDSTLAESHARKENALYNLGRMYWTNLKEPNKAVDTFRRLVTEYPQTEHKPEAYYIMYLASPADDPRKKEWKNKLAAEFPSSTYLKLLTASGTPDSPAENVYEEIYTLYVNGSTEEALSKVDDAIALYRGHELIDRFAFLRLFIIGKSHGVEAYREAIVDFMRMYPESRYLTRAREMLNMAEQAALLPGN